MPDWTIGDCPDTPEKRTYASKAAALRDRRVFHGTDRQPRAHLVPYECSGCRQWHLTRDTPRRRSRHLRRPK